MNHETKLTAAVHSARNTTVATAVLAKLCTAAQLFSFVRYFLVAEPSEYKIMSVEHF
jgi:hypothetical protein